MTSFIILALLLGLWLLKISSNKKSAAQPVAIKIEDDPHRQR